MKKKEIKKKATNIPVKEAVKIAPDFVKDKPKSNRGSTPPVTYQEHLDAGFVSLQQSENLQKAGKRVVEIKNVEGKTLHKIKE